MKKINDFDKVQEVTSGAFPRIPDGAYVVGVKKVEDVPDKEFLRMELDICKGEYKNFWQKQYDADKRDPKYWPRDGVLVRSYKQQALGFFKGFITAVTKSNKNFTWNWNEQDLKNKVFSIVISTEEYVKNNGNIGTRPYIASVHSVEAIEKGDFTIPALKTLDPNKVANAKKEEPFLDPFADAPAQTATPAPEANPFGDSDENPFS